MSSETSFSLEDVPQDPFLPQVEADGPTFLDTEACLCALQPTPAKGNSSIAWQCIGDQVEDIYNGTMGKWFNPIHRDQTQIPTALDDDSNPPDLSQAFVANPTTGVLQPIQSPNSGLSVYNQACTGINQTTFTTSYYRSYDALQNNQTSIDMLPCWRVGAIPLQIQNVSSWQSTGCLSGFFCPNNTVNSLPLYCPPLTECQELRLAGGICFNPFTNSTNNYIGMGPFEPVLCQKGFYCPPGGTEILVCPKGSYCQDGTAQPTQCTFGSYCPEGSYYQTFAVPLLVLLVVDILMGLGILIITLRYRSKRKKGLLRKTTGLGPLSTIKRQMTGYATLPEETEMLPVEQEPHMPSHREPAGFQSMLEMEYRPGDRTGKMEAQMSPHLRHFVESMRRATDAAHFGLSFEFDGLSFHPKKAPKPILQNITGSISRGSLTAVMGGSGAGKSTFVNVLMGKTVNTGGSVTINGMPDKIRNYKKIIGYVPQDDIVIAELTVYENILHSARIRLPRKWPEAEIKAHVDAVIQCLELSHVRDSLVGSVGKPTISGGQRKRVSIGMELAAAPMAVFLDEPTSGLDATSASSLMQTLKAVAKIGISVIVIIHQPRMEIFEIIDDLILLANGQLIYEGPERDVQQFFRNIEFEFPEHSNYGDVVTDIITGNGRPYKQGGDVSKDALIAWWAQHAAEGGRKKIKTLSTVLSSPQDMHSMLKARGAPHLTQFYLCLKRAMLQQYRLKSAFWFEAGLAFLGGFLIGLAEMGKHGINFVGLYQSPYELLSVAINYHDIPEMALLTAIGIGLIAGSPGVKVFSEETLVQRREAEAGHSQIAYFMAKTVSALPRMALGCMHFTIPLLFLSSAVLPFSIAFTANLLYFYCIYGLASIVSMVAKRQDAPLFATMLSLVVGILSGAAPSLRKAVSWHLGWLWRASPGVYIAEVYFAEMITPLRRLYQIDIVATYTGYHLDWVWLDLALLAVIGTVYRLIAFAGLYLGKRLRV